MRPTNSKQKESDKLSAQIKEYLSRGGRIKVLPSYQEEPLRTNNPYNHKQHSII